MSVFPLPAVLALVGLLSLIAAGVWLARRRAHGGRSRVDRGLPPLFFVPTTEAPPPSPVRAMRPPAPPPPAPATNSAGSNGDSWAADPQLIEGKTVRFYRPMDGTLQFLPGRLEIVEGDDLGADIRFVRTWGGEAPEITFGRNEGPPYRHVQLRAKTVSRNHARMELSDQTWKISNLSATNPVLVNGRELGASEQGRELHDGDRIEMGEVVFRFRER